MDKQNNHLVPCYTLVPSFEPTKFGPPVGWLDVRGKPLAKTRLGCKPRFLRPKRRKFQWSFRQKNWQSWTDPSTLQPCDPFNIFFQPILWGKRFQPNRLAHMDFFKWWEKIPPKKNTKIRTLFPGVKLINGLKASLMLFIPGDRLLQQIQMGQPKKNGVKTGIIKLPVLGGSNLMPKCMVILRDFTVGLVFFDELFRKSLEIASIKKKW